MLLIRGTLRALAEVRRGGVRLNGAIGADVVDLTGVKREMARRWHRIRDGVSKNRDPARYGRTPQRSFPADTE
jgi:hypothetical protein